jgi:hypothetical protein
MYWGVSYDELSMFTIAVVLVLVLYPIVTVVLLKIRHVPLHWWDMHASDSSLSEHIHTRPS